MACSLLGLCYYFSISRGFISHESKETESLNKSYFLFIKFSYYLGVPDSMYNADLRIMYLSDGGHLGNRQVYYECGVLYSIFTI